MGERPHADVEAAVEFRPRRNCGSGRGQRQVSISARGRSPVRYHPGMLLILTLGLESGQGTVSGG